MIKYSIISVGCNCKQFVKQWHKSIVTQSIPDFECFIAIDPSDDSTPEVVKSLIKNDSRFKIVKVHKQRNHGALYNRYICTRCIKNDESIIMHLDLDDHFFTTKAIAIVRKVYRKRKCWITYGSYTSNAGANWNKRVPDKVWANNSHRRNAWSTSALRTFKKWLWDKIDRKDFVLPDGEWIKRGTDLAFMFPMLEMAGKERVVFIKNTLYYYNVYGLNDKQRKKIEQKYVTYTRSLPPYNRIRGKHDKSSKQIR